MFFGDRDQRDVGDWDRAVGVVVIGDRRDIGVDVVGDRDLCEQFGVRDIFNSCSKSSACPISPPCLLPT